MVFDRVYSKGYAVVFDDVIEQINALLPVDEDFAGGLRDEQRDFSPIAVREIVANACVHQDFTEHGGIATGLWRTSRDSRPTRRNSSSGHAVPPSSCARDVSRIWA